VLRLRTHVSLTESVLVTGAAGFIGVPLVRQLLREGHAVTALDNFRLGRRERLAAVGGGERLSIVEADITDRVSLAQAVQRAAPQRVFHLAALHFIPYCESLPQETIEINVVGLLNLLDALKEAGPARLLFMSTADVYQPSEQPHSETSPTTAINVYGASKLWGEWVVQNWLKQDHSNSAVIVRLFNTYGPGETNPHVIPEIVRALEGGSVLRLGNIAPKRDFIYVADTAAAITGLMWFEQARGPVNVATGHSASVAEVLKEIGRLMGREVEFKVDQARFRQSDRPNLQADTAVLARLLPEFNPRGLADGLSCLLADHGLIPNPA